MQPKIVSLSDAQWFFVSILKKCRIRVRECRRKQFDISRNFLDGERNWIANMLKDEFKELEENIQLEDFLYEEFVDESYKW